ncbi:HNH endonuclease [Pseudomonas jessenii]|nr:HNH endonuclease [Pseudomonas jessenii]
MPTPSLYSAIRDHDFSETTCFLCGNDVENNQRSREHVFPKWLLHHFGLLDHPLTLLNGTRLAYRNLVIPCCQTCNNECLSSIEREVQERFMMGAAEVASMDRGRLLLWVLKIFYGLLYRELFLSIDRRDPAAGNIVSTEDMEQFQLLHFILQSCRVPMDFSVMDSDIPASVFVFEVQEPSNADWKFDYKDDVVNRTLYLRLGNVGILAAFDMGAQTPPGMEFFSRYQGHLLHPLQFAELGANLFMKARVLNRTPKVIIGESSERVSFSVISIAGLSSSPVFGTWEAEDMAEMLMFFLGYPLEMVMPVKGRLATWLTNSDGSLRTMSMDAPPWAMPADNTL